MTTTWHMLIIILLCGIITLIVRIIPFLMITRVHLSENVVKWLSFIPITLFTALVIDGMIIPAEHGMGYTVNVPFAIVTIPTVIVALLSKSLTITILFGMALIAGFRFFF